MAKIVENNVTYIPNGYNKLTNIDEIYRDLSKKTLIALKTKIKEIEETVDELLKEYEE